MNAIVEEARRWIGTPYTHQASVRGAGCDCLGLIRGVWRSLYVTEPEVIPNYTADWGEPQEEELLLNAASRHLNRKHPVTAMEDGDVLLFRMRADGIAKHLGILSRSGDAPQFIHAYSGHGVVESPLSGPWLRRLAARFAFQEG